MPPNRSKSDIRFQRQTSSLVWGSLIGVLSTLFLAWFLSLPVLSGYLGADGEPVTRLQFLSRLILPELWIQEWTAGGHLRLGILDRIPVIAGAAIWLLVSYVTGLPLLENAIPKSRSTRSEYFALATLAGLAILSTVTLLIGLAGASAGRWPIFGAVACVALGAILIRRFRILRGQSIVEMQFSQPPWLSSHTHPRGVFGQLAGRLVAPLTVLLAMFCVLGFLMPPYEFDVLEYHLQAAKEFYQQGHIGFVDHNIYMNMPLGVEMHSLAAMSLVNGPDGWWLGGLIGKTITGAHSLLAAMLISGFCARKYGRWVGWCGAGLWLAVPGNIHVSSAGLVDVALGTYVLASAVVATQLWQHCSSKRLDGSNAITESPESTNSLDNTRMSGLVFLLSLYAGGAAAIKYPGLIFAVFPGSVAAFAAVLNWIRIRDKALGSDKQVGKLLSICLISGLLGGLLTWVPWYAKNTVLASNPVYPLAYSIFGGRDLDAMRAAQWAAAHRVPVDKASGSGYSLTAAMDSLSQVWLTSTFAQPALTVLLGCVAVICGFGIGSRFRETSGESQADKASADGQPDSQWVYSWLAMALWIFSVWWFATHRIDRFWLPAIPLCCGVAAFGIAWIASRVSHSLAIAIVLVGLIYGCVINASSVIGDNRFFVSLAALRSDSGDEQNPGRISRSIGWCNANLSPESSNVALIGEARAFDFRIPIIYSTCFDRSPVEAWLRGATAPEQEAHLSENEVTHVLINWSEIERYRSPGNYGFSDWPQREDIEALVKAKILRPANSELDPAVTQIFEVVSGSNVQ